MAHEIMSDSRFLERVAPGVCAWHGLGVQIAKDEKITVADAMHRSGADYNVIKLPEFGQLPDGGLIETGRFLVYREAHAFNGETAPGALLGDDPVGKDYTVIQNSDIAAMLEPLAEKYPLETIGVLRDGAVLFVTFDGGEFDIKGDALRNFFLVSDSKDGKRALSIDITPVRVVCANTLRMGIRDASFKARVPHDGGRVLVDLKFWTEAIPQIAAQAARTKEALARLADVKATPKMIDEIVNAAFPAPKQNDKITAADQSALSLSAENKALLDRDLVTLSYNLKRITGIRDLARESVDIFNQNNPKLAGTLYAVANGVNEVAMWRKGHEGTIEESAVFGTRAAESIRAFRKAFQFTS